MSIVAGIVSVKSKGVARLVDKHSSDDFAMKLPKDKIYLVGVDQSTNCTGVYVRDIQGDLKILVDIKNNSSTKEGYYRDLFHFFKYTFSEQRVAMMIHEKPVPGGNSYGANLLHELKGRLEEWRVSIAELNNLKYDSIYPQVWRKYVVDKSKPGVDVKGVIKPRSFVKTAIVEDIVDKFPEFTPYMQLGTIGSWDSFESLGILEGYIQYAFDENWDEKIHGTIEKSHGTFVSYVYKPAEYFDYDDKWNKVFEEGAIGITPKYLVYNNEYSLQQNILMASSSEYQVVVTQLPYKFVKTLRLRFSFEEIESGCLLMYVFRKGALTKNKLAFIKSKTPMCEEVNVS